MTDAGFLSYVLATDDTYNLTKPQSCVMIYSTT